MNLSFAKTRFLLASTMLVIATISITAQERKEEQTPQLKSALEKYNEVREFKDGFAIVLKDYRGDRKFGFIDTNGKEIVPCKYDYVENFHEGLAIVRIGWTNSKYGFINTMGNEVVSCIYDFAYSFHEGLAAVRTNGKWGFVNNCGEVVIPFKYDDVYSFQEGLAVVRVGSWENGKYGFINTKDKVVVPCIYDYASSFNDGLACVKSKDKYGYINTKGKEIIPLRYNYAKSFKEGLASVKINDRYGFINKKGKEVVPCKYDNVQDFYDGLAVVMDSWNNRKYGVIDSKGKEIVPCKYDDAYNSSEGMARVVLNGRFGYVNTSGIVIPCKYYVASGFKDGTANVMIQDKCGKIDKKGVFTFSHNATINDIDWLINDWGSNYNESPCLTIHPNGEAQESSNKRRYGRDTKQTSLLYDKPTGEYYVVCSKSGENPTYYQIDFAKRELIKMDGTRLKLIQEIKEVVTDEDIIIKPIQIDE